MGSFGATVKSAYSAWEAGHSIIAARFNLVLAAKRGQLSIQADKPPKSTTLDDLHLRLLTDLGAIHNERPGSLDLWPDIRFPWTLGHVQHPTRPEVLLGEDSELEYCLRIYADALMAEADHKPRWKAKQWQQYIVDPIERNARVWREGFNDLEPKQQNRKMLHRPNRNPVDYRIRALQYRELSRKLAIICNVLQCVPRLLKSQKISEISGLSAYPPGGLS
jgi:hypothetical protein